MGLLTFGSLDLLAFVGYILFVTSTEAEKNNHNLRITFFAETQRSTELFLVFHYFHIQCKIYFTFMLELSRNIFRKLHIRILI